jgi:hypothetical protein
LRVYFSFRKCSITAGTLYRKLGFEQAVLEGTRDLADGRSNLLDVVLVRPMDAIIRSEVLEGISDHKLVLIEVENDMITKAGQTCKARLVWQYKKADKTGLKQELWDNFEKWALSKGSVEGRWIEMMVILRAACHRHIPSKNIYDSSDPPYYNRTIRKLKREARVMYKNHACIAKGRRRLTEKRKQIKKAIGEARDKYFMCMLKSGEKDGWRNLYGHVRRTKGGGHTIPSLVDTDGVEHTTAKSKADALNRCYSKTFTAGEKYTEHIRHMKRGQKPMACTIESVLKAIKSLKIGKSPGLDGLTSTFLKIAGLEAAVYLDSLYSQIIREGVLPTDWKKAIVIPIHKGGEKKKIGNYRPISLTSTACKVFEKIVCSYLRKILDNENWLSQAQHGFRAMHSCDTQLVALTQELADVIDRGGVVDAAFLDMRKAFDTVPHSQLIKKIDILVEDKAVLKIIADFLTNRTQAVRVEDEISAEADVTSGVPQGSVLGPLLFIIFINNIVEAVSGRIRLFADDCVVYRQIQDERDEVEFQSDIDAIGKWMQEHSMQLNLDKCEVVRFGRKNTECRGYELEGKEIKWSKGCKYLGVWLDEKLDWKGQVERVINKGTRSLNFVMRVLKGTQRPVKDQAYKTLVRPILEYGGMVWDPYRLGQVKAVENVQRAAARRVTGRVKRWRWDKAAKSHVNDSPSAMVLELGWESLGLRRGTARLCGLHRAISAHQGWAEVGAGVEESHSQRKGQGLRERGSKTEVGRNSFLARTIREWNMLAASVRENAKDCSTKMFKHRLNTLC